MAKINFGINEKEQRALENRATNLPCAKKWLEKADLQFFTVRKEPHKYTLKAFLSTDNKIIWMEFRSTSTVPSVSCPVGLHLDPQDFTRSLDQEWRNFLSKVAEYMERVNANA